MTTALAEKTILDTEPVCRPARKSFAPILPARDIIVPIPADFRLTSGEALTDPVIRARLQGRPGAPLVIVCPAYVYGPGDDGPGGRFLRDLLRGRVPGLLMTPAWFSFVHVDDVVAGIILALDHGSTGGSYVLSGEDATINDFAQRAARIAGVRAPFLRFPPPLAHVTGRMLDALTRATGVHFPITAENVRTVSGHRWLHSHAKATAELGWKPRTLAEGLPETIAWLKTQNP